MVLILIMAVCTKAAAMVDYFDDAPIADAHVREEVAAAVQSLKDHPTDVKALDVIAGYFGEDHVNMTWITVIYASKDEVKKSAYDVLLNGHSIEFLCKVIAEGSDLAARWAIIKASVQFFNSGGINDAANNALHDPLMQAIRTRKGRTRAEALTLYLRTLPIDERSAFRIKFIDDKDESVAAAAIDGFAERNSSNEQVLRRVWDYLAHSENEDLLTACCKYLWLSENDRKERFEEHLPDFERLATHPSVRVRSELSTAIAEASTPAHPKLIAILLKLAEDKDEGVRGYAIRSLYCAKTTEVKTKLLEFFKTGQPQIVRRDALGMLAGFGKENEELVISAAKDKDSAIRCSVAYYLRMLGTEASITVLESLLHDPDDSVRRSAETEFKWVRQ